MKPRRFSKIVRAVWPRTKLYILRFFDAEISTRAAALAFNSILAVVPVLGLLYWYLSKIGVTEHWLNLTRRYIMSQLSVDADAKIVQTFQSLTLAVQQGSWNLIGLLVLLYTTITLLYQFSSSLDVVIGKTGAVPKSPPDVIFIWFRRLVVMLGLPVALTFSLVVTNWIRNDSWLHYFNAIRRAGPFVSLSIPWFVDILVLFLVYCFIPTIAPPWRKSLKVACVVGPISELTRYLFSIYSSYAVSVHKIYGVLATIPLVILWIQIAWMVLLTGALFLYPPEIATAPAKGDDQNTTHL